MIKDKFLFFIILVLALASVSMVSAQDPSTNITSDSGVIDCTCDLNTTSNNISCVSHTHVNDSNNFTHESIKESCLNNQNNNLKF